MDPPEDFYELLTARDRELAGVHAVYLPECPFDVEREPDYGFEPTPSLLYPLRFGRAHDAATGP